VPTQICTKIERDFLRILQGGCSTPIAGFTKIVDEEIIFKGSITAVDGSESIVVELKEKLENASLLAQKAANEIINKGGKKLLV
jgi:hydroxymethylbilane synthase